MTLPERGSGLTASFMRNNILDATRQMGRARGGVPIKDSDGDAGICGV
jgi:hypothetical protein